MACITLVDPLPNKGLFLVQIKYFRVSVILILADIVLHHYIEDVMWTVDLLIEI